MLVADQAPSSLHDTQLPNTFLLTILRLPLCLIFIVFLGLIPALLSMENNTTELNLFDLLAFIITAVAIIIETLADNQLRTFKRNNKDKTKRLNSGIWKYIKYPNYFGENLFWWGLFIFAIAANFDNWKMFYAPLAMTLLFVFVSIPMMKKRLSSKKTTI